MELKNVVSSNIAAIGYDQNSSTLEVRFNNGGIYHYHNVPLSIYNNLMAASSHGGYLASHIIKGGYRYTKIR
ncbi:MAG: KTSC domain-containing protein [Bacteroidales bacterium]